MKRLVIAAVLAVGLLASAQGQAQAQHNGGIGINIGLNFGFTGSGGHGGGGLGCWQPSPCWSPCYPPPTPWGGLSYSNPYSFYPSVGSYPMFGGVQALPSPVLLPPSGKDHDPAAKPMPLVK